MYNFSNLVLKMSCYFVAACLIITLHYSWTLYICCGHLYNEMCIYIMKAFNPWDLQIWSVFANANSALLEQNDYTLRIQNAFCFEVFSLSNSESICFKSFVFLAGFKSVLVFKALNLILYCLFRLETTTKDSTHA